MNNKLICSRPNCDRATQADSQKYFHGLCDRHARSAGLIQQHVDPELARREIHRLYSGYWLDHHICKHTGITAHTLTAIIEGTRESTRQKTLDKLRALPTESPYRKPAWPLTRRIQSLRGAGITAEEIANKLGLTVGTIHGIQRGLRESVEPELDTAIRDFFEEHKQDLPRRLSPIVADQNLPLPMQWEDIDDPVEEWPLPPRRERSEAPGHLGATNTFYSNFDTIMRHVGNDNAAMSMLRVNITTLSAWKERTAVTVTINQYQRVFRQARKILQATQKEAA